MLRGNIEAQATRQANGAAREQLVGSKLGEWGEKDEFMVEKTAHRPRGTEVSWRGRTIAVKPDFIIWRGGTIVAYIGVKNSLRERWKQEDRDALLVSPIPWICIHGEDKVSAATLRNCAAVELFKLDKSLRERLRGLQQ